MADPQTVNVGLAVPVRGSDVGTWDLPVNADFSAIDGLFGGVQALAVPGTTPITLTAPAGFTATPSGGPTQSQNMMLRLTGTPTGNVIITLPLPCRIFVDNQADFTGGGLVILRGVGVGQVVGVPFAAISEFVNDGTNVKFANLTPLIGEFVDYAGLSVPGWVASCTVPPLLNCNGGTFSAVTYPLLNAILGGNTLPDLRGVARYTLNQGTSRLTSGGSGLDGNTNLSLKTTQTYTLNLTNLPPYTPTVNSFSLTANISNNQSVVQATAGSGLTFYGPFANQGVNPTTAPLTGSITLNAQGGTSVPFGVVGPGTVAGITMIRAG